LLQRQRGFGLALELGEVALAQRRRGGQRLQSLDLADDLTSHPPTKYVPHSSGPSGPGELRVGDANSNSGHPEAANTAHASMTSSCHNGRGTGARALLRSAMIAPRAEQPTTVGSGGGLTDTEP
jgi:hypothetical protein